MVNNSNVSSKSAPVIPLNTCKNPQALFCLPPVGGQVIFYKKLAELLDAKFSVYGIESPGLTGETAPLTSIEALAAYFSNIIKNFQPAGPYILLGWSMGGLLVFEITRQLLQTGPLKIVPILLDTNDPKFTPKVDKLSLDELYAQSNKMTAAGLDYVSPQSVSWRVKLSMACMPYIGLSFQKFAFLFPYLGVKLGDIDMQHYSKYLVMMRNDLSTLNPTEFPVEKFVEFLKLNKMIGDNITADSLLNIYNVFRANYYASENYHLDFLNHSIIYFKCDKREYPTDWRSYAQEVKEVQIPCNHYQILKAPESLQIISQNLLTL